MFIVLELTRDSNLADAQDRARVFAALNMPKIDTLQLPPLAQLKCHRPVQARLILATFLSLRRTFEIEIEKRIPRLAQIHSNFRA